MMELGLIDGGLRGCTAVRAVRTVSWSMGKILHIVPALPVIFPSSLEYPLLRMLGVKGYFML